MEHAQMWNELKGFLVNNRNHAQKHGGRHCAQVGVLDTILEKMQQIDPAIQNKEIYYNGSDFNPANYGLAPKEVGAAE
ncbi:hypothetical protein ABH62_26130 [Bacillus cereus]|uniref:hypothetical protein n=1 Tax=Bacillus cereus TaxID=1396 RepID=UPI0008076B9E|nr:hypothetical protein [Bacillus cereus]OBZ55705.1 hypothetical protein ABH62_26130 [Bacillus cereus]HDX9570340.1 hypothetical protein [Bacillus thuringiensis]